MMSVITHLSKQPIIKNTAPKSAVGLQQISVRWRGTMKEGL